jgi:hypothetical protein
MDKPAYLTDEQFAEAGAALTAKRKARLGPAKKPRVNGEDKFLDGVLIVELECAANIKPEPILWLWKNWLALGKLHILAGQPGKGKSTIALKIAAAVSSGGKLPDGTSAKRGGVVIWSAEDDASDTLTRALKRRAQICPAFTLSGGLRTARANARSIRQRTFSPYARRSWPLAAPS